MTAVAFIALSSSQHTILVSGSVDKSLRAWKLRGTELCDVQKIGQHESSINCVAWFSSLSLVASGSADATVKLWQLNDSPRGINVELIQIIEPKPRFFPLSIVIHDVGQSGDVIMAVAGTRANVEIYLRPTDSKFERVASLPGHEGWIRSLAISKEELCSSSDLILASASQDKYIRLWRIATHKKTATAQDGKPINWSESSLSNKRHVIDGLNETHLLTFEALLLGHEDWVYSLSWRLQERAPSLQLLSASADNSVAIWEPEISSGIWTCSARLGEISLQKGSTTATGSTGGFWKGLWSSDGTTIISLVGTGSWRLWKRFDGEDFWSQMTGISGHTKVVTGLSWSIDGRYLLSTSKDQTTRLHAEWKRSAISTWHEFGRPQIHGYDLNCVASVEQSQFVSGADEKLLRVFDEPRDTAEMLESLSGIEMSRGSHLPESASIPVLGLSNKTAETGEPSRSTVSDDRGQADLTNGASDPPSIHKAFPPTEDHLARFTLWPEREKLYGHGHEISALSVSHDGSLVATSCKASALEHAVIRLYRTDDWREVKPALSAHSLTVTAVAFSPDDQYLLSVGRDRQWALFERSNEHSSQYVFKHCDPKGHSRMILDACWAPTLAGRVYATAGRDKSIKIWTLKNSQVRCEATISLGGPVTALDIAPAFESACIVVSAGTEQGDVRLYRMSLADGSVSLDEVLRFGFVEYPVVYHTS